MVMKRSLSVVLITVCLHLASGCSQVPRASRHVEFIAEIGDVSVIQPFPANTAKGKRPCRVQLTVKSIMSEPAPFTVGDTLELQIPETHELVKTDYVAAYPYRFPVEVDGNNKLSSLRLLKE